MSDAIILGAPRGIDYTKDFEYTTNSTSCLITKYIGTKKDVVVPSRIEGKPVVIQNSSYYSGVFTNNRNIISVKFSEGVSIANNNMAYMFNRCFSLVNAPVIPANVTSMDSTFYFCDNLVNAPAIPANVTNMSHTFAACTNLVNAPAIPASVTSMDSTFTHCTNLVNAPDMSNATNVNYMSYTFSNCDNLVNAPAIPTSVTSMDSTFESCISLVNAPDIPASVTSMDNTFHNCTNLVNAPDMSNAKNVQYMGFTFFRCSNLVNAPVIPANVTNMGFTFYFCDNLVNAPVIPANVTYMDSTFESCISLVNAPAIPTSVTSMNSTFVSCTNLVNAPDMSNAKNVQYMGFTFFRCSNLVNAPVIPANVTYMSNTFSGCTNLTGNIYIKSNRINNTSMQNCFNGTTLPKNVYIPSQGYNAVANTWNAAFNATYGINGKNGVTVIDDAALDWTYTTNDTATLLTKYTGAKADVVVPTTLAAKPTLLSTGVFKDTSVNSADLQGVNFANLDMANAFNGCTNLKSVKNMSPYINQANDAFHGCTNLTGVYAQNENEKTFNVTIGSFHNAANMFRNCYNMTRVPTLNELYTDSTRISNYSHMFENCSKLSQIYYDFYGIVSPEGDTIDMSYMFANCSNLIYSNCFGYSFLGTTNASHAFDNTGFYYLGQITDPGMSGDKSSLMMGFTYLNASYMFANCKNMTIANFRSDGDTSANFTNIFYNCQNLTDVKNIPNGIASANYMFANCRKLVNISPMQKGLLGAHDMCQNCVSLKNAVEIPDTVTSMWGIYRNCSNLVNVPLTAISLNATDMDSAFYGCTNLVTAPIIPPNITDLRNAFNGCTNLTGNVAIYTNKLTTYASVFYNTTKAKNVYIYNANTTSNMWNVWNNTTSGVNGKNGVTLINMGAWENACWTYSTSGTNTLVTKYKGTPNEVFVPKVMNGRNVVLQNSAGSTSGVFTGNSSIKRVKFENGVNITNDNMGYAFYTCYNLVSAPTIPANVTNMDRAFYACRNLISAPTIPVKVTNITAAFGGCHNLVSAPAIPNNVTNMYDAFDSCYSLKSAPAIPTNVTDISRAFSGCRNLVSAPAIPASVINMGTTFSDCNNLVSAPDMSNAVNVANIAWAFYNCQNLVNAPNMSNSKNVTNMVNTFRNCVNLTRGIRIGSNRINNTSMQNCFYGTTKAKNVYVPFTGYNAIANTYNAATNSTYGISGKNGVAAIYDINTSYEG